MELVVELGREIAERCTQQCEATSRRCVTRTTVTVASRRMSSSVAGMPTMLERPITTALLPAISTPERSMSSMQPLGVHATYMGSRPRCARKPMLSG